MEIATQKYDLAVRVTIDYSPISKGSESSLNLNSIGRKTAHFLK